MSTRNLKEAFECELCIEGFNQYDRKPITQVPCGHTICQKCLDKLEINKTQCPFCRVEVVQKIPNWEIIKRLPKPSIPLVYNQLKVKLDNFAVRVNNDYFNVASDVLKTVELLGILMELMNKDPDKETPVDPEKGKPLGKKQEYIENLQNQQTFLNNFRTKKLEYGDFLMYKCNTFKKDIEKEEFKYNEQRLKVIKADLDNLSKILSSRNEYIRESNKKLIQMIQAITNHSAFKGFDESTNALEEELKEIKRYICLTQPMNLTWPTHGTSTSNAVRPQPTAADNLDPDAVALDPKQKAKVVGIGVCVFLACVVYPIAMIVIGKNNWDECTINRLIPVWCVVSGITGVLASFLIAVSGLYIILRGRSHKSFLERMVVIFFIIIPLTIIIVFCISWFFAGNSWIYTANKNVQFSNKYATETYCNETLFLFSFWTLNVVYILIGTLLLIGNMFCCIYCFVNIKQ